VITEPAVERAERLIQSALPPRLPRKRLLVIANPYATTVSARLKNLVVYALRGRYEVDAVDTTAPGHATVLCTEAAQEGYDAVVAFGGDGTVNEAASGLVGSATPLTCLPGGSTNVFCRTLGIPADVVDATEHLLRLADGFTPFRVDVGKLNGRAFVFSSGVGLDASVVERVDSRPALKARLGEYYYTYAAMRTFLARYVVHPPRLRVEAAGRVVEGVTAVVQNSDPYTFFGPRAIRVCENVDLDSGTFALTVLRRARPVEIPTLLPRLFSARSSAVQRHRQIEGFSGLQRARVTSMDERPLPVQVDGDYVGTQMEVDYEIAPRALSVVA
jgi:diacylglycerol kinase family enzyme